MKKTLVLGASTSPERYSFKAINLLRQHGHTVVAVGRSEGKVADVVIQHEWPTNHDIDTLTMYVAPQHQKDFYDSIVNLKPKRIIFNPGTENAELEALAHEHGIATEEACTLVLLNTNQY